MSLESALRDLDLESFGPKLRRINVKTIDDLIESSNESLLSQPVLMTRVQVKKLRRYLQVSIKRGVFRLREREAIGEQSDVHSGMVREAQAPPNCKGRPHFCFET